MSDAHSNYLKRRHVNGLDGIRCVAILAVVWHHSPHPDMLPIMDRGFFGVDLFFVLSGFLISTLLIREKAKNGRISLKNFWMRRVLRLVPAYYLLLFGLLGAYLILKPGSADTAALVSGFPAYALYLSNWIDPHVPNLGPTWSLATEEQFYLVWPLFEAFAAPVMAAWAIVAGLVLNQLINFGVLDGSIEAITGWGPTEHPEILQTTFTPILLGVGLAHLLSRAGTHSLLNTLAGFKHAPFVFAGLLVVLLNIPAGDISGPLRFSWHLAAMLFVASVILSPQHAATRALDWKPVAFVGTVSYGMYLYHMFCLHAASVALGKVGLNGTVANFMLGAALTIGVSAVSYLFLEKRFLDMRKKFRPTATISDEH